MSVIIALGDLITEMAEVGDNHTAFLNRKTGELLTLSEQQRALIEHSQQVHNLSEGEHKVREAMEAGDLLELPSKFEHHEYSILERFCESVTDAKHREQLLAAIRGKRAFRDFERLVGTLGMSDQWIGFRTRELESLAIEWLERNNIAYEKAA